MPGTPRPRLLHGLETALIGALAAEPLERGLEALPQILASATGSPAVTLLRFAGGSSAAISSSGDESLIRRLASDFEAAVRMLSTASKAGPIPMSFGTNDGILWVFPLLHHGEPIGAIVLVGDSLGQVRCGKRDRELLSALASRLAEHEERARLGREHERHERWFRTFDQQLRVLERERQKLAAVVNQSDLLAFVADASGLIRWANKSMSSLPLPAGARDWRGQQCRDVCTFGGGPADECRCGECPVARACAENRAVHEELRWPQGDTIRNLYLTALPIREPDGRPTEVMVLLQDLTNLEVLRRSESRYRMLFEQSANAILMVDPSTRRVLLANPTTRQLLGYDLNELERLELPDLHPPHEWTRLEPLYAGALGAGRPERFECVLVGRDGVMREGLASASRFDLRGEPVVMLEFQDLTDRRRAETALRDSEEQLRQSQKLEAVGRLAGGVAHDFNNLLTVIMGRSERLRDQLPPENPLRSDADQIHSASQRGAWLTRQLLAFGRRDMPAPQVLELGHLLRDMEDLLRRLLGEDVELVIQVPAEAARVQLDRGHVEQVIMNLAVNARDAMPQGGRLGLAIERVEIGPDRPVPTGPFVRLTVTDSGCGMDEATRLRLFEPFFTTKQRGSGTGLGLSIVYGIVTRAGGAIEVESEPGQGATVRVLLPRVEAMPLADPVEETDRPTRGRETVLVVEDDDAVRAITVESLRIEGYDVLEAATGSRALEIAAATEGPIQALVTDVVMPKMGGVELAQRLATMRPGIRVLFVSGYTDDDVVRHGVLARRVPFLQKPFALDNLALKLREVLELPAPELPPLDPRAPETHPVPRAAPKARRARP